MNEVTAPAGAAHEVDEHHQHIRYTIVIDEGHWWRGKTTLVLEGVSSSLKDSELLIFGENDGFTSINFSRVVLMTAEKITGKI